MLLTPIPIDDAQRLEEVHSLGILDSDSEERFDRITRIAHHLFDIPYVFITLVDHDRVWFKSKYGCDVSQIPRDNSFCGRAICNLVTEDYSSRLFEVLDVEQDDRFYDDSLVIEKRNMKYYLGFVLQSEGRRNIGTLCMIDSRQRAFSSIQKKLFIDLGLMAEAELNNSLPTANRNFTSPLSSASNAYIDKAPKKDFSTIMDSLPDTLLSSLPEEKKEALEIFLKNFPVI